MIQSYDGFISSVKIKESSDEGLSHMIEYAIIEKDDAKFDKALSLIIEKYNDINDFYMYDITGGERYPLSLCCSKKYVYGVKRLIEEGVDVNQPDNLPLLMAAKSPYRPILELLFDQQDLVYTNNAFIELVSYNGTVADADEFETYDTIRWAAKLMIDRMRSSELLDRDMIVVWSFVKISHDRSEILNYLLDNDVIRQEMEDQTSVFNCMRHVLLRVKHIHLRNLQVFFKRIPAFKEASKAAIMIRKLVNHWDKHKAKLMAKMILKNAEYPKTVELTYEDIIKQEHTTEALIEYMENKRPDIPRDKMREMILSSDSFARLEQKMYLFSKDGSDADDLLDIF